jgi:rRNA-processing protein FCF1
MNDYYVIIDSNFLFLPFQFKIDYLNEIEMNLGVKSKLVIFQQIIDELNSKQKREPNARKFEKNLQASKLYLEKNMDKYNIQYIDKRKNFNETTDEFLLNECINYKAENNKVFLATNDSDLRKKANELGIHTIYLKQKKYLVFD